MAAPAQRRQLGSLIQQSTESLQMLATRFGLHPKMVAKWRGYTTTEEAVRGPKPASTALTPAEEAGHRSISQRDALAPG